MTETYTAQRFVRHHDGADSCAIDVHYDLQTDRKLGEGGFGQVFVGVHKHSHDERAVKEVDKADCPREEVVEEFNYLKELDHPDVLKVYDLYEGKKQCAPLLIFTKAPFSYLPFTAQTNIICTL